MIRGQKFFYGWIIVAVTFIGMLMIYGVRHTFAVFFAEILDEFGWKRGSTAFIYSLNLLVYASLAPLAGSFADRFGPRKLMPIGISLVALPTAACAFANSLWHFYLLFGIVLPMGMVLSGWPIFAPALANWFVKKLGMAIGVALTGAGFSFTLAIFAEYLISVLGWRSAYIVLSGMVMGVVLPLVLLFFHYTPESKGLKPFGWSNVKTDEAMRPTKESPVTEDFSVDWTLARAVKTYRLWLLVLAYMLYWGMATYMVLAHQVVFVEDAGYDSMYAASAFGLFGLFMAVGQLLGFLSDRMGREPAFTLATILCILGLVILLSIQHTSRPWILYFYSVCFGLGAGFVVPALTAGTADIFHGRHFGAIHGMLLLGMGIGGGVGPWLGGFLFDLWGSYTVAFIVCMVVYSFACIAFWIAAPRKGNR